MTRTGLTERFKLQLESRQDICTPARGTERDFPAATTRDDERTRLVVKGERIGVRTDGFRGRGVDVAFADVGAIVGACATVRWSVGFRALGETGVKDWSLDGGVWIWVDAITRCCGLSYLEIPWTPVCYFRRGLSCFVGDRIGTIRRVA